MQAYAWDLETNAQSVQNFTNPHQREQGKKMVTLTSQRDIYENNANMATRRLRARILAILPSWFVEDCIAECKKTLIIEAWGRIYVDKVTDKNCYAIHTNVFKRICKEGGFNDKAFISWALKNGLIIGDSNNKPTKRLKPTRQKAGI